MKIEKLSNRELRRYSKQIMVPEVGVEGQLKLRNANVLVIGAGGLGCPVLQYLSASGVGHISIIDFDMVDETNLARQTLYGSNDLGKLKSIIAKSRLEYLNPLCEYTILNKKIDASGNLEFFRDYDIIVDATDNPETRYAISDASVLAGKPMVHGSIFRHEGIISVFNYRNGPSYRDFNPAAFAKSFRNPAPATVGFFGILPGITGMYMANEVIKIITGTGEVLSGKIFLINIFNNTFNTFLLKTVKTEKEINQPAGELVPA